MFMRAALIRFCLAGMLLIPGVLKADDAKVASESKPNAVKPRIVPFSIKVDAVMEHDDGQFLWYHPRATPLSDGTGRGIPEVLITIQKHLNISDYYSGLHDLRSADLGKTWNGPRAVAELDWVHEPGGVDIAVADVTPRFHPRSGKVIAVGAQVRYSKKGEQLEDQHRANQTAYAVYDPKTGRWTKWKRLELPADPNFDFALSACAQFVVEDDGTLLLPFYIGRSAKVPFSTTVVRCAFDGQTLNYREHGEVHSLNVERGLYEPSLVRAAGRYYLTLRNDLKGYVTKSVDGIHYEPEKPWTFDDGKDLGSYNTQQHWLAHGDALFLVYTRRGANNDHMFRHRAPLFIAQVDPDRLHVIRSTERVLIPERGGEMGNFGAVAINDSESWVTVSEGLWNDDARRRGAKGATFVARVRWEGAEPALPKTRQALETGGSARVVCFGDSVTGVYYHTGSRRAYTDMLGIALQREFPKAKLTTINAGISGNTTKDALARIDRDVLAHKPTLVTVMFGLNDMTRVSLEDYRKNLREIAEKCCASGAEVLFCTPNNVITTPGRPTEKLREYCQAIREEANRLNVPVCDVYGELDKLRERDAQAWRLLLSDEIHPNMAGHQRMAETLARTITGRSVDLSNVRPFGQPFLRTADRIAKNEPVRVLAMPPFDDWIKPMLEAQTSGAKVEVTRWPTEGKSLAELELDAKERVRAMKPDLVLISIPRSPNGKDDSFEGFVHAQSWLMNWSLDFGPGTWDCLTVHPSVLQPDPSPANGRDALIRQLVKSQDLSLIDRGPDDKRTAEELFQDWMRRHPVKRD